MATITFDTHKFIRRLTDSGFLPDQAEAISDAFKDAQAEAELATKRDIDDLRHEMRGLEYRLTFKLGGMMVLAVSIVAALVKLL
jgi:hypothetical protein